MDTRLWGGPISILRAQYSSRSGKSRGRRREHSTSSSSDDEDARYASRRRPVTTEDHALRRHSRSTGDSAAPYAPWDQGWGAAVDDLERGNWRRASDQPQRQAGFQPHAAPQRIQQQLEPQFEAVDDFNSPHHDRQARQQRSRTPSISSSSSMPCSVYGQPSGPAAYAAVATSPPDAVMTRQNTGVDMWQADTQPSWPCGDMTGHSSQAQLPVWPASPPVPASYLPDPVAAPPSPPQLMLRDTISYPDMYRAHQDLYAEEPALPSCSSGSLRQPSITACVDPNVLILPPESVTLGIPVYSRRETADVGSMTIQDGASQTEPSGPASEAGWQTLGPLVAQRQIQAAATARIDQVPKPAADSTLPAEPIQPERPASVAGGHNPLYQADQVFLEAAPPADDAPTPRFPWSQQHPALATPLSSNPLFRVWDASPESSPGAPNPKLITVEHLLRLQEPPQQPASATVGLPPEAESVQYLSAPRT
ncbi:hypothetical protein WJX72_000915 [[Myrmecia] bisecta]|uniref:Uncharacterized protein n=1 Tax=[Myrmecia] bisecta TaxID=41462 RepID=A0AAW1Q4I8_9CHLO